MWRFVRCVFVVSMALGCVCAQQSFPPTSAVDAGHAISAGKITATALSTPTTPVVTPTCTGTCATTYTYIVVANLAGGGVAPSSSGSTAAQASTLDATHFNGIATAAVTNSSNCDLYRTVGGATQGLIATGFACGSTITDNALTGDSSSAPSTNTTGKFYGNGSQLTGIVTSGGALGTPASGTATNIIGLPEGGLSLTDIATNNSSTSNHGFLKKLDNVATHYMGGDGNWTTVPTPTINGMPFGGGTAPTLGTCPTGSALATGATNNFLTVNVGSGVTTSCVVNFGQNFTNTPTCVVGDDSVVIVPDISTASTSSITITLSASLANGHIRVLCQ